ncbi:MAG: sigma factor [Lachnospiraceae bacterium]
MKNDTVLMQKWIKQYYNLVYHYAYYVCNDRSLAEKVADKTFEAVHRNIRRLKKRNDAKGCILQTARYFILKEIYSSWERGESITEKYNSPDTLDPETIQRLIRQYEDIR